MLSDLSNHIEDSYGTRLTLIWTNRPSNTHLFGRAGEGRNFEFGKGAANISLTLDL